MLYGINPGCHGTANRLTVDRMHRDATSEAMCLRHSLLQFAQVVLRL
jgi:hypothetical protein